MAQLSSQFPAFVNVRVGRRVSPRGKRGRNTAARVTFIPRHEEERTMGNPRNYRNHPSTNLTERRWEERGGERKDAESLEENSRAGIMKRGIMLTTLSKDLDAVFRSNRGRGHRGSPPRCIRHERQP